MFKKILSEKITSNPDTLQFAKDRRYEEAWIIRKTPPLPEEKAIQSYLSQEKFETLIAEFIWNSQDDDHRFVLTLFQDRQCRLKDPFSFPGLCLDLFQNYPGFEKFIQRLNQKLIGWSYLFSTPIESIDLGIFNHWLSVGPLELWREGGTYQNKMIRKKIRSRPEIEKSELNYQGLLFRFNVSGKVGGPCYGIKTPCCKKEGSGWMIDYPKLDHWVRLMLPNYLDENE